MLRMKRSALVCTWLACDILLDLLWRLAGSPSRILSMLQPHDSIVFRDSLTGQLYASLSWSKIKRRLKAKLAVNQCCKYISASSRRQREMLQCFLRLATLSESALYGFNRLWVLEVSHICSPNDQPLENCKHTARIRLTTGFSFVSTLPRSKKGWANKMQNLMCSSYLFQTPLLMDVLCILDYKVVQFLRDHHTVDKGWRLSL